MTLKFVKIILVNEMLKQAIGGANIIFATPTNIAFFNA
jgi:hypothetical protein